MKDWNESQMKLLGGVTLAVLGLAGAFTVMIVGMFLRLEATVILALAGPFGTITGMAAAFFFGQQDGYRNGYRAGNGKK